MGPEKRFFDYYLVAPYGKISRKQQYRRGHLNGVGLETCTSPKNTTSTNMYFLPEANFALYCTRS
ncbi:MAG: hypothetical protein U0X39_14730 [Bacteroidales bacterium]